MRHFSWDGLKRQLVRDLQPDGLITLFKILGKSAADRCDSLYEIGAGLAKNGRCRVIFSFGGGFYIHECTAAEGDALALVPTTIRFLNQEPLCPPHHLTIVPAILDEPQLEDPEVLKGKLFVEAPVGLRGPSQLVCFTIGNTNGFYQWCEITEDLGGTGTLNFSFLLPPADPERRIRPIGFFFMLCYGHRPGDYQLVSSISRRFMLLEQ